MPELPRPWLPRVAAPLLALALVVLATHGVAASTDFATSCSVLLRASPSTSGGSLVTMPPGIVVTTTATLAGGSWSASCPAPVSGSTWYAITSVNGTSVSALYGVSVAYGATGLFQPAVSPPPPPAVYVEGIDVSHYQASIDWTQVPGSGKRFAIMEATRGGTYVDPTYATNHAGARAVGLAVGAYHFAQPGPAPNDAVLQADWFVQNAAPLPGDLLPALDLEQTGGLSAPALQAWVDAWLNEVTAQLGVRPMVYTSPNFWRNAMGDTTMFADEGYAVLWVAHWSVTNPSVPANNWSGHGWTFWQYSDCGTVPGIASCVDLDRFNGADVTALAVNYTYVPPPIQASSPPVFDAIAPNTIPAGGGDLTVAIQGANFVPGISAADWNGVPLATTYVSPTQLTAVVPAALTATPGTSSVTILNQPPGSGTSAPGTFMITLPVAQLSVTPSVPVIALGQPVRLTIQIAAMGANRTITVQRMQANETQWSDIGTLTTDASGQATLDYTPPVNTQFQAVYPGEADLGAGTSPPVRVVVRQLVQLRPTSLGHLKTVSAGGRVTFTATVRPIGPSLAPAKVTFQFWRQVSGHWRFVTKRDAYVDASGRASWMWRFTSRGRWYVRAVADPSPNNANSSWSSPELYLVV